MYSERTGRESVRPERKSWEPERRGWEASGREPDRTPLGRAILGMAGGFVATLVMTAFRLPISRSLPPTADFWATYVGGGDPEQYTIQGIVLHLFYGAVAGGVFGALVDLDRNDSEASREVRGAVLGTVYGLTLSAFGTRVLLEGLLGMALEPDERLVFHLGHVVYGLTLGTWLGSRE